jgi:hypothetical protein
MADIGGKNSETNRGDVVVIPPRLKHKFTNSVDRTHLPEFLSFAPAACFFHQIDLSQQCPARQS